MLSYKRKSRPFSLYSSLRELVISSSRATSLQSHLIMEKSYIHHQQQTANNKQRSDSFVPGVLIHLLLGILLITAVCSLFYMPLTEIRRGYQKQQIVIQRQEDKLEETRKTLVELLHKLPVLSMDSINDQEVDLNRAKRAVGDDATDNQAENDLSKLSVDGLSFLRGRPGIPGVSGRDGRDGSPGISGPPGAVGPRGERGDSGQPGPRGIPGRDGRDGIRGVPGAKGDRGEKGAPGESGKCSPGMQGPKGEQGEKGTSGESGTSGTVFTHWGRTTCSNTSQVIYSGRVASASHDTTGGGVNFQCLPPDPELQPFNLNARSSSTITGTEYESQNYGIFPDNVDDKQAVCSVCYTESRPALLVIPARKTCPTGWVREYHGFMMAAMKGDSHPSTDICIDSEPEYLSLSHKNGGGRLVFVNIDCLYGGSVGQCDQYIHGRQLTCVVCTK